MHALFSVEFEVSREACHYPVQRVRSEQLGASLSSAESPNEQRCATIQHRESEVSRGVPLSSAESEVITSDSLHWIVACLSTHFGLCAR